MAANDNITLYGEEVRWSSYCKQKTGVKIYYPSTGRATDQSTQFHLKVSSISQDNDTDPDNYGRSMVCYLQYYNGSWNNWRSYGYIVPNYISWGSNIHSHSYWDNDASETARHNPLYINLRDSTVTSLRTFGSLSSATAWNYNQSLSHGSITLSDYYKYAFCNFNVSLSHCTASNYRVTYAVNEWGAVNRSIALNDFIYCGEKVTCDLAYDEGYEGPATYTQLMDADHPTFTYVAEQKQNSCYIYVDGWKQAEGFIYVDGWKSFEPKIYVDGWKGMG